MRILHYLDTTDLRRGGPQRMVFDSCRVLAARGHSSIILAADTTDAPAEWLAPAATGPGPTVRKIPSATLPAGLYLPAARRQIREELRAGDVLHFHCIWSPEGLQIGSIARELGIPYIVSTHGMFDDWAMTQGSAKKRLFLSLGGRALLEQAAAVHCTAEGELAQAKKWFNGRGVVVPPMFDLEPFRQLPGPDLARRKFPFLQTAGRPVALFLSRMHHQKRPEALMTAAAELRDQGFDATFVFAGTGDPAYIQSLHALIARLKLQDRAHLVGLVSGADKLSLYQAADLFCHPSYQDNFGYVLVEALACGTPLVTTRAVDIWPELTASGAAVIIDDPIKELAAQVRRLLTDHATRRAMAEKARPWALGHYDEARSTMRIEKMYEDARGMASKRA